MQFHSTNDVDVNTNGSLAANNTLISRSSIVERDWDFSNNQHAIEFELLMQEYHMYAHEKGKVSHYNPRQRKVAIAGFNTLQNIRPLLQKDDDLDNTSVEHNNCVVYIDKGKPDTIVTVSAGNWVNAITRNALEHQNSWMLNEFDEYNVISIVEDNARVARNPILYDSCLYQGISDELDSIEKLSTYLKQLIPNTKYHIVADCKNGHSACILAHAMDASSALIQSGITHCNYPQEMLEENNRNTKYEIDTWSDLNFQVQLKQIQFCKDVPVELTSINNIAKVTPSCNFTYIHHNEDAGLMNYIDTLQEESNVTKIGIDTTRYTYGNHYITLELRKSKWFLEYFDSLLTNRI